ncbi:hypothetical protein [Kordiimonas sp. SCSIO 12610]|nr:hypothetical protein [Kordiimonas sp. SCSIO 12610]
MGELQIVDDEFDKEAILAYKSEEAKALIFKVNEKPTEKGAR